MLSALTPERVSTALAAVCKALRPGGVMLFRDYAVNDGAHKKMTNKKGTPFLFVEAVLSRGGVAQAERKLAENFYVRGDGTQVLYFDKGAVTTRLIALTHSQMC